MAKRFDTGWTRLETVGLLVVALGAAFFAYSAYSYFSTPVFGFPQGANIQTGTGGRNISQTGSGTYHIISNGQQYNGTGAIPQAIASRFGMSPLVSAGDMLSGVLAVLLGFMIFKYGNLRKVMPTRT